MVGITYNRTIGKFLNRNFSGQERMEIYLQNIGRGKLSNKISIPRKAVLQKWRDRLSETNKSWGSLLSVHLA